jgi:hypothetical protein
VVDQVAEILTGVSQSSRFGWQSSVEKTLYQRSVFEKCFDVKGRFSRKPSPSEATAILPFPTCHEKKYAPHFRSHRHFGVVKRVCHHETIRRSSNGPGPNCGRKSTTDVIEPRW